MRFAVSCYCSRVGPPYSCGGIKRFRVHGQRTGKPSAATPEVEDWRRSPVGQPLELISSASPCRSVPAIRTSVLETMSAQLPGAVAALLAGCFNAMLGSGSTSALAQYAVESEDRTSSSCTCAFVDAIRVRGWSAAGHGCFCCCRLR